MDVFSFSSYKITIPFVLKPSVPELSFLPLVVQSEQKKNGNRNRFNNRTLPS